jgi:hypothetical protein
MKDTPTKKCAESGVRDTAHHWITGQEEKLLHIYMISIEFSWYLYVGNRYPLGIHLEATRPTIYLSMVLTWYLHGYPPCGYSANYLSVYGIDLILACREYPWVSSWWLLGQLFIYIMSMVLTWYLHAGNTPGYPPGGYSANSTPSHMTPGYFPSNTPVYTG